MKQYTYDKLNKYAANRTGMNGKYISTIPIHPVYSKPEKTAENCCAFVATYTAKRRGSETGVVIEVAFSETRDDRLVFKLSMCNQIKFYGSKLVPDVKPVGMVQFGSPEWEAQIAANPIPWVAHVLNLATDYAGAVAGFMNLST